MTSVPVTATASGKTHHLDASVRHYVWDNSIPPRLEIDSGDTVVFECKDAGDGYYTWDSTVEDMMARAEASRLEKERLGPGKAAKGHALTGPVLVRGAKPGDVLQVEILDLVPGELGYTSFRPGLGLLPEDFPDPYLHIWDLRNGQYGELKPGIRVPFEPFLGVMGTALDEAGEHATGPPRKNGGNADVKQLTKGTTLYLPVWVDGALFSCGDGHAAQGDGEVCISAIETSMTATLRFTLRRDFQPGGAGVPDRRPALAQDEHRAVLRHHGDRAGPDGGDQEGRPQDAGVSGPRARADPRGGVRPLQRGPGSQDQRDRGRPELGRQRVHAAEHLPRLTRACSAPPSPAAPRRSRGPGGGVSPDSARRFELARRGHHDLRRLLEQLHRAGDAERLALPGALRRRAELASILPQITAVKTWFGYGASFRNVGWPRTFGWYEASTFAIATVAARPAAWPARVERTRRGRRAPSPPSLTRSRQPPRSPMPPPPAHHPPARRR